MNSRLRPTSASTLICVGCFVVGALFAACGVKAGRPVRVAVASNFSDTAEELASRFEKKTGRRVMLVTGSTVKHFAQIEAGARIDVFLAADSKHPRMLEKTLRLPAENRITYAFGRLVLWSPKKDLIDPNGEILRRGVNGKIAVANPRLAPYGIAAFETMRSLGVLSKLEGRLVRGENVGQAFQFVSTGNAELGFVAYSQVIRFGGLQAGSMWIVPGRLYEPIEQQALLLSNEQGASKFLEYLGSKEAVEIIYRHGYGTP